MCGGINKEVLGLPQGEYLVSAIGLVGCGSVLVNTPFDRFTHPLQLIDVDDANSRLEKLVLGLVDGLRSKG